VIGVGKRSGLALRLRGEESESAKGKGEVADFYGAGARGQPRNDRFGVSVTCLSAAAAATAAAVQNLRTQKPTSNG